MSYVEVHQVWSFIKPKQESEFVQTKTSDVLTVDKTRNIVQMARIKKKYDIISLANEIEVSPKSLSLYEKGEDVLSKEVMEKLFRILEIPIKRVI